MKVNKRIRDLHRGALERYGRLEIEVRDLLKPKVEERGWFFVGRLKGPESFALKIETGRFEDPGGVEDFYGRRIVVPTLNQIEAAKELVAGHVDLRQRRPPLPLPMCTRRASKSISSRVRAQSSLTRKPVCRKTCRIA
jgi:hypothetical protein